MIISEVEGSSGSFVSHPSFGESNYSPRSDTTWVIRVAAGKVVRLWFSHLDLQFCCDSVRLFNGFASGGRPAAVPDSSARNRKVTFVSTTNSMILNFRSDATVNKGGFRANFLAEESGESQVTCYSRDAFTKLTDTRCHD
jgi:hypothetical protein